MIDEIKLYPSMNPKLKTKHLKVKTIRSLQPRRARLSLWQKIARWLGLK